MIMENHILGTDYEYEYEDYTEGAPDLPCPPNLTMLLPPIHREDGLLYCNSSFDSLTCWPTTQAGHYASVPCPTEYQGAVLYPGNATKFCFLNGTWKDKADYQQCITSPDPRDIHDYVTRVIFFAGYTVSTLALVISLFIFWYFKSLRCLRNTIHCHLMMAFVLRNLMWILLHSVLLTLSQLSHESRMWICKFLVTFFNYLGVASFFWMLVEGLYLHTMIVWAYSADKVKFWIYAILGWGGPLIFILIWASVKATLDNHSCWEPDPMTPNYYDYIYITPVLIILLINIIFLASIEYVLIAKLKANSNTSNNHETRQYKRAVRGTVILFPLLGLIYVILITEPGTNTIGKVIFLYSNAILQSLQGLLVAVFYCFLNAEVRHTVKKRIERWKERRSVTSTYSRASRGPSLHYVVPEGNQLLLNRPPLVQNAETGEREKFVQNKKRGKRQGVNRGFSNGTTETSFVPVETGELVDISQLNDNKLKSDDVDDTSASQNDGHI